MSCYLSLDDFSRFKQVTCRIVSELLCIGRRSIAKRDPDIQLKKITSRPRQSLDALFLKSCNQLVYVVIQ